LQEMLNSWGWTSPATVQVHTSPVVQVQASPMIQQAVHTWPVVQQVVHTSPMTVQVHTPAIWTGATPFVQVPQSTIVQAPTPPIVHAPQPHVVQAPNVGTFGVASSARPAAPATHVAPSPPISPQVPRPPLADFFLIISLPLCLAPPSLSPCLFPPGSLFLIRFPLPRRNMSSPKPKNPEPSDGGRICGLGRFKRCPVPFEWRLKGCRRVVSVLRRGVWIWPLHALHQVSLVVSPVCDQGQAPWPAVSARQAIVPQPGEHLCDGFPGNLFTDIFTAFDPQFFLDDF
jgi:hypothetical protein